MKRRLVGAFVLVSLAVIFLPMLLEEQGPEVRIEHSNIPPQPPRHQAGFQSSVMPLPEGEPLIPPQKPAAPARPEVQPPPSAPAPPPKAVAEKAAPEHAAPPPEPRTGISAWAVQVASLSSKTNADKLVASLRAKGHNAFLEQVQLGGRVFYRVRVGPEADRARAERNLADIERQFKLKGQVVRYP